MCAMLGIRYFTGCDINSKSLLDLNQPKAYLHVEIVPKECQMWYEGLRILSGRQFQIESALGPLMNVTASTLNAI